MTRLTSALRPASYRRRLIRLGFIAAACAFALTTLFAGGRPAGGVHEVSALRREIASLREELTEVRRAPEQDRQTLEAEAQERIRAQAQATEAALEQEAVDVAWSSEALELIIDVLATEALAATTVEDLECRTTLCRLRVSHQDPRARAAFERQFPVAVAQLLPQLMAGSVEADGDRPTSVFYLARAGHDLPSASR